MKKTLILLTLLLAACSSEPDGDKAITDQCLRTQLFQQCMAALPAGPVSTQYNDWDEVVDQCDSTAYWQSQRARKNILPACRPGV